jgi:hypothetical protein
MVKSKIKSKKKIVDNIVKTDDKTIDNDDDDVLSLKLLSRKIVKIQNNNLEQTIKSFLLNDGYVSLSIY